MKKMMTMLLAVAALFSCASNTKQQVEDEAAEGPKVLVAYFSATGTTAAVAERLALAVDGELFAIEPEVAYTADDLNWKDKQSRSSVEMEDIEARPEMKYNVEDIDQYDVIYLGFPVWWNTAPRIVNTFIEANALDGKTVIPFATSGSSTIDQSVADLKEAYPEVDWRDGKLLNGVTDEDIELWVNE